MKYLPQLFERNRAWAAGRLREDPDFFSRLSAIQRPDYLWIGCSDSRVPANEIVGLAPGEMFVHRNIANVVLPDDRNCMAVVQYAIESLSVRHVIVCGHYGCGGIQAALEGSPLSTVTAWLKPVRRLAERHRLELASIQTLSERRARLCELNVVHQVDQLANSLVVRNAVAAGRRIILHGWIYDLRDGLLRDLSVSVALG